MKKDQKLMKFTSFVLLVVIIALILVAGTFAKYTSEASGSDTAIVAKWSFEVNGDDITQFGDDDTVTFNLFETILEEDGSEEKDVLADENGDVIRIAPGTSGKFALKVNNTSEVTAKYTIGFGVDSYYMKAPETEGGEPEKVNVSIPLQYYISDEEISDLSTISDEDWTGSLKPISNTLAIKSGEEAKIVYWKWAFENNNDENDTVLGINTPTVTVTATITAEQFDDSETNSYENITLNSGNAYRNVSQEDTYVSASKNVYLEAGTTITLISGSGARNISVYYQGSETPTSGETLDENSTSITIDTDGWYGIAVMKGYIIVDGKTLGDFITISK